MGRCRPGEGSRNQEVYLIFSPANIGLRSRYALRLYGWAKEHASSGTKRISLEQLRTVLGLNSIEDAEGKIIKEAPLQIWANLRQRALNPAIAEINKKTDLRVTLKSLKRSKHRRVDALVFAIETKAAPNVDSKRRRAK